MLANMATCNETEILKTRILVNLSYARNNTRQFKCVAGESSTAEILLVASEYNILQLPPVIFRDDG